MNMKEQILVQARNLISDKTRWCRCALAQDEAERGVNPSDATARKWCAVGALEHCSPTVGLYKAAYDLLLKAAGSLYHRRLDFVNDELGHEAVLEVYNRAIELARQEGPGEMMP
ncbi:MAG: hypothetical protein AAF495_12245 [Pseudomonadota bacterium]